MPRSSLADHAPQHLRSLRCSASLLGLLTALLIVVLATTTPAQSAPGLQFAELPGKRHLPQGQDSTQFVAFGDVDGDGDLDLVCGNDSGQNRLYLNSGGTFTDATATHMPVDGDSTRSLALGDVDGDGDLDLVYGNVGQNRLYLNSGGTFTDATATHIPVDNEWTLSLALGDVDGDGDLDLVCANDSGQNRLYLNSGGTFTDATAMRMPVDNDNTWSVALGDIDGDGDLDLVCGSYFGQNRLYLNSGGTFTDATATHMPVDSDFTRSVALGDVDGDGDLDLVLGTSGIGSTGASRQNRLYLNSGGTFTDATATRLPVDNDNTSSVALGDVDGDGDLDMVCGNFAGQNRLYLNTGGAFTNATATRMPEDNDRVQSVALGDVDGDGDLDLVCGNTLGGPGGQNRLYLNSGGTFTDATTVRMPVDFDNTSSLALGDVDGDGDLDLVCGNGGFNGGQNRLYLNSGGAFTDATATRMPVDFDNTLSVALGDVDGDGDLDLVCGNRGSSGGDQNRLYLNSGGTFTDATATRMPVDSDATQSVALGDVDGDGDLDLVCGNSPDVFGVGGQNRLYLNSGGTFTDVTTTHMPMDNDRTSSAALIDVDGDGDLDLVCGNSPYFSSGQSRLYLNTGGTFTDATATHMPVSNYGTVSVAFGDVDGDGDPDLVCGNSGNPDRQNRLYLNSGGTFTDATATHMPVDNDNTRSVALGDIDGDGDLDLVCGSYSGQNRLYLNSGGTFTDATATRMPADGDNTRSVALGDIDSDNDLDLVCGNDGNRRNNLYLNLHRQLDAPHLLGSGQLYTLEAYSRYGTAAGPDFALIYLSTTRLPTPVPVIPFGTLFIDPMISLPFISIPQATGVGAATWNVPSNPAFAGIEILAQALIVQGGMDYRFSNATADWILP